LGEVIPSSDGENRDAENDASREDTCGREYKNLVPGCPGQGLLIERRGERRVAPGYKVKRENLLIRGGVS